jgi:hypothetical protein
VIKLSPEVKLPVDAVTQTFGILAMKRMGKSYTARRLAEQLLHASLQTVIVDPKGDWWGIRASADGKKPGGYPVVIFGGEHGDVPLEPGSGEIIAKLVAEERVSALLDLSLLRKGQVASFMTAFLETLYRLKARERFRTPMMLIIDEADAIAPQRPQHGEERMLGAAEDIVRRGGQRGIGCTMITQRAAVINKNVLTQVQVLVVLRTIGKKDRDALDEWIEVHGSPEQRRELMASIAALPKGDAWLWSPGWPTAEGIFVRTHIAPIETFDSGETPKPGKKPLAPKMLADVDLEAVQRQMADTVERAKQDDPKALRAEVQRLKQELAKAATKVDRVEVPVPMIEEKQLARLDKAIERAISVQTTIGKLSVVIVEGLGRALEPFRALSERQARPARAVTVEANGDVMVDRRPIPLQESRAKVAAAELGGQVVVTRPRQRILDAIDWFGALGIRAPSKVAVALVAGVKPTTGSYGNNLGALRTAGYIEYPKSGQLALTNLGKASANGPTTPVTNAALHQMVYDLVPAPQARILRIVIDQYPADVDRGFPAEQLGVDASTGSYGNNLGALRTLGVIDYPAKGRVVATDLLFPRSVI